MSNEIVKSSCLRVWQIRSRWKLDEHKAYNVLDNTEELRKVYLTESCFHGLKHCLRNP